MNSIFNSPADTIRANMKGAETKGNLSLGRMILLGLLAGAFIALGAATSSTAAHGIENVGIARLVSGVIFPVGLMLIVICGGELFTGNCLMGMAALNRQIFWGKVVRNLVVVWLSNFAGALVIAFIVFMSGNFNYSSGELGAYTIKVALGKAELGFGTAFFSGILCNMLVVLACWFQAGAKSMAGKIFAVWFPPGIVKALGNT